MKKTTLSILFSIASFTCMFASDDLFMKGNSLPFRANNLSIGTNNNTPKLNLGSGGDAFQEGTISITAGYGFPNLGKAIVKYLISDSVTNSKVTGVGPLHFKAEYGLSDKIGLGISVNYITYGLKWNDNAYNSTTGTYIPYTYNVKFSSLSILARFNIHFATTDKLDPYWGIGAGYKTGQWDYESNDPDFGKTTFKTPIPFGFETTIGMRYYFTDAIGLYGEIGIAKSIIQAGIAIKL